MLIQRYLYAFLCTTDDLYLGNQELDYKFYIKMPYGGKQYFSFTSL